MKLSYKKLFKKLIDLGMSKSELIEKTGICRSTLYKVQKGENITTDVLLKICNTLKCDISEIVECVEG